MVVGRQEQVDAAAPGLDGQALGRREERIAGVGLHAAGKFEVGHHIVGGIEIGLHVAETGAVVVVGRVVAVAAGAERRGGLRPVRHHVADEHDAGGVRAARQRGLPKEQACEKSGQFQAFFSHSFQFGL